MENWIFKILGNIELVNKRLFYLLEPYATKIIKSYKRKHIRFHYVNSNCNYNF